MRVVRDEECEPGAQARLDGLNSVRLNNEQKKKLIRMPARAASLLFRAYCYTHIVLSDKENARIIALQVQDL